MSAATTTRSAFFAALLVVDATLVIVMAVAIGISSFATDTTKQLGKPPDSESAIRKTYLTKSPSPILLRAVRSVYHRDPLRTLPDPFVSLTIIDN